MPREFSSEETVKEEKLMKVIDAGTGKPTRVPAFAHGGDGETPLALRDSTFQKISTKPLNQKAAKILRAPVNPETEIDILPSGEIYMSHVYVRRRLSDAVGPAGWALRPLATIAIDPLSATMYREYALVILGRVVATAFGSAKYFPSNKRMDFADSAEAVKSNALTRCCKDLNIGSECWDRRFAEDWRNKHAVHVRYWTKDDGKDVPAHAWRRIDQRPFYREYEIFPDSPNQEKWRQHFEAWAAMVEADKKAKKATTDKLRDYVTGQPKTNGGESTEARHTVPMGSEAKQQTQSARPTTHDVHATAVNDRGFMIRECKISSKSGPKDKKKWTHYLIEMLNGDKYYTFSHTTYGEMQKIWAARSKVEIAWQIHKTGTGSEFKDIVEWKVLQ